MTKNILIALVILSSLTVSSCLKKQNLDDDDLGPAVAPVEVTKALGSGYGSYDYNEIKKNEFTSVMLTQRIQDSVTQNIRQQGMTVNSVSNTVDSLNMDLIVEDQVYSNGQSTQSTRQWPVTIPKATSSEVASKALHTSSDAELPMLNFLSFEALAFGSCYDSGKYPETCHRLQVSDIQYKVPLAAAHLHDCPDIMNCFIPAKKVELDLVRKYILDKDGKPSRTHYTLILSPQVPFLSRVLQLCSRAVYQITESNQKILADICYSVTNYAPGTATTTSP